MLRPHRLESLNATSDRLGDFTLTQNASPPPQPLYRRPAVEATQENRFHGDLYEREQLADRLTGLLERLPDGAVLSIDSPWGEGKTWFGKRWRAKLEDQGFRTAYIDCFARDHIEDPFAMVAGEFLAMAKKAKPGARGKLLDAGKKIGASLLPSALKFAVNTVGHLAIGHSGLADDIAKAAESVEESASKKLEKLVAKSLENYEKDKQSVDGFKTSLAELAAERSEPIVIFVDELDRCRPDFAVRTIERIKHFFDVPGIVFVLLINRKQLVAAIKGIYGAEVDGEAYLGKFVQLSLSLPKRLSFDRHGRDDNRKHIEAELARYGFPSNGPASSFAAMAGTIGSLLELSLRDMERAVALFSFGQPLGASAGFAAWPVVLKLARPSLFKRLRSHDREAHMEAYKLAALFKEKAPDAKHLIEFFEELHNCGSGGFASSLPMETSQTLAHQGHWSSPRSYLTWIFERIELSVAD